MEISKIPRNPGGTEHAQTVCSYQALFSPPTHRSLGTRLSDNVLGPGMKRGK